MIMLHTFLKLFTLPFTNKLLSYSLLFTLLLGLLPLNANSISVQNKLIINEQQLNYSLANHIRYFEDKTNALTLQEVEENASKDKFIDIKKDNISLGYIKSTIWLNFVVDDQSTKNINWQLLIDYPLLDNIVVFSKNKQGIWQEQTMGDHYPFSQRPVSYRAFLSKLNTEIHQTTEFYVKVNTTSSMQLRLAVVAKEDFLLSALNSEMFFGLIYGIMIMMALYNFFLYLAVRDTSYLIYVFSVISGCVFIMSLNGHAFQYIWPEHSDLANTSVPLLASLWMVFSALFTHMFLETKRYAPRLYIALNIQILLALFSVAFSLLGPYQLSIKLATGLALFNGLLILLVSVVCWRNGNRFARYFVIAWLFYGVGTAMLIISRFGVLPDNFITHNSSSLGLLIEIIMLSLALSDKYRVLTQALEQQTIELEHKVDLRTQELEISNQQLVELSRTDALTGLANRRHLDHQLLTEWERSFREKSPLSLLICDIDQFKNINDHFGHQYGDDCILAVAEVLKRMVNRPGDIPARFGGDEFVVILPNTESQGAIKIGQQVCDAMISEKLEQAPDAIYPLITMSIGCATIIPQDKDEIKTLFTLADKNLYQAKKSGRNCVVAKHEA